jgi:hypothetical protein
MNGQYLKASLHRRNLWHALTLYVEKGVGLASLSNGREFTRAKNKDWRPCLFIEHSASRNIFQLFDLAHSRNRQPWPRLWWAVTVDPTRVARSVLPSLRLTTFSSSWHLDSSRLLAADRSCSCRVRASICCLWLSTSACMKDHVLSVNEKRC